jgi:hypothetical protein
MNSIGAWRHVLSRWLQIHSGRRPCKGLLDRYLAFGTHTWRVYVAKINSAHVRKRTHAGL